MTRRVIEVLLLKVCLGYNVKQIEETLGIQYDKIVGIIRKHRGRFDKIPKGRLKHLFPVAIAGLIKAYCQCVRCGAGNIHFIDDDYGTTEGVRCGRCGNEMSLIPSAASLRR